MNRTGSPPQPDLSAHLVLSSRFENIEVAERALLDLCAQAGCLGDDEYWLVTALREALANAIRHGNQQDPARTRAKPVDEMLNPLLLSELERAVLMRVAQGQSVPDIASSENRTMHQIAKCIRGLYRKMTWDLRATGLSLERVV